MKDTFRPGAMVRLNEAGRRKMQPAAEKVGWDMSLTYAIEMVVTVLGELLARLEVRDALGEVVSRPYIFAGYLEPAAPARP